LLKEASHLLSKEPKVNEPRYNFKFTFDIDENDHNLIREFIEPEIKFRSSEYEEKDDFIKLEINKENFFKLFNQDINDEPALIKDYYENNSSEFKDDLKTMLSNTNPKKMQKKHKNNKDKDYLVYDVNKNIFYKKFNNFDNNMNPILTENENHNINNIGQFNKSKINAKNISNDSPKMMVKVNRLPLNFIENYIN